MPKVYKYILTLFILNTDKQVLWQKVKTQMKCCIWLHFRVLSVKIKAIFRNIIITSNFGNFTVWPLKTQDGLSLRYCFTMFGKIHQNEKGCDFCFWRFAFDSTNCTDLDETHPSEFTVKIPDFPIAGLQIRVGTGKWFFLLLNQNICCGYSKETSQWDGSFEHPLNLMGKEINAILCAQTILIWTHAIFVYEEK